MTTQEAIEILEKTKGAVVIDKEFETAYNIAIKSLEAWEKVREDVLKLEGLRYSSGIRVYQDEVIDIIDEHLKEVRMADTDIKAYNVPTNGSIFLKTYPDLHISNIAYDDGVYYVYVDLGGSRIRFTSDWWNATYKEACRAERN